MKRYLIILLSAALFGGCLEDANLRTLVPVDDKNLEAALTLRITGADPSGTRAFGEADENRIDEIDVLVFHKSSAATPDADAEFFYRAQTVRVVDDSGDSSKKSFRVTLLKSDDLQQLVVLANSRAILEPLLTGFEGESYADVMEMLELGRTTAWNSISGTGDPFPMWGQNGFRVFTSAAAAADEIELIRALARVDVAVAAGAQADFTMNGVWLHNPSTKAMLAPQIANWDSTEGEVTVETIPASGRDASTTAFAYATSTLTSLVGSIYTFEAPAAVGGETTDPCLIVRGSWKGAANSYYRLDFHDGTDFLPLLRNYKYLVSIDEVNGDGYASAAEALTGNFTQVSATTHMWSHGNMGNIVWDGSNYLTVSTDAYHVYPEAQNITKIYAATNWSDGWKATVKLDSGDHANWLTLTTTSGTGSGIPQVLNMTLLENTEHDRTATITVTAGRLTQTIRVTQLLNRLLSLDVGDMEVVFSAVTPEAFTLPIEWEPAAYPVTLELINPGTAAAADYFQLDGYTKPVVFSTNPIPSSLSDTDNDAANGGLNMLTMLPAADNTLATFEERRSILKVTTNDGARSVVKTILLRQFEYAIVVTGTQSTYQLSTTYSFTVKSNGQWEVAKSGATSQITYATTGGEPNITGTTFSFTTGSTTGSLPVLTFRLSEHTSVSQVVNVPLKKMQPNCIIVAPNTTASAAISVANAYEAWKNDYILNNAATGGDPGALAAGSTYTLSVLWQDVAGLVTLNNTTLAGAAVSAGTATFTVKTSVSSGNAVVVLKEGSTIRWSWHIWVTTYNPNTTYKTNPSTGAIIMDRNLGAITNAKPTSTTDVRSHGLLYQACRKDPFVGANATTGNTSKTMYNGSGTTLVEGTTGIVKTEVTATYNMANAVKNPLTFYWSSNSESYSRWWYSSELFSDVGRKDLWLSGNDKTLYDPCPDGWRVPVQHYILTDVIYEPADYEANYGINLYHKDGTTHIGFFPQPGHRAETSGNLGSVGTLSYLRTAGYNVSATINDIALSVNAGTTPGRAGSVRCVKIQ